MKIVDNPQCDINVPAIKGLRLAGVGGVRRSGPAELMVDAGPAGPDDGPAPSGATAPSISPRIFATPEVLVELGAAGRLTLPNKPSSTAMTVTAPSSSRDRWILVVPLVHGS